MGLQFYAINLFCLFVFKWMVINLYVLCFQIADLDLNGDKGSNSALCTSGSISEQSRFVPPRYVPPHLRGGGGNNNSVDSDRAPPTRSYKDGNREYRGERDFRNDNNRG